MKQRIEGRVIGERYQVHGADGAAMLDLALADARKDKKLAAAIERNGWEAIPEESNG